MGNRYNNHPLQCRQETKKEWMKFFRPESDANPRLPRSAIGLPSAGIAGSPEGQAAIRFSPDRATQS